MSSTDATVVLVHGAWADGSSWAKVIAPLAASGVKTIAAPLPLTSFQDDVAALDRALERVDGRVVLAGHAYAGGVIGATRQRQGEGARLCGGARAGRGRDGGGCVHPRPAASASAEACPGRAWVIYLPEEAFAAAFAQNASKEDLAVLAAVQRPISPACITVKVGRPLWKDRPAWFLVAEQDRMIIGDNHRFMAERMKARIRSHPVDHTPLVTAPSVVIDIIREAIGAVVKT
jgi:pimeloyl-ACP methyl ester carboxylesterase